MKDNFSIQDWRMNLLTEVENEMPIGNREMPLGQEAGVTDEHQAILKAIQDMVMAGDHKILDLIKDKMQAEWGDDTITEAADLKSMFPTVDKGEMDNDFFIDLFDALGDYFVEHKEELTNMDAMSIANHLKMASRAVRGRSSN